MPVRRTVTTHTSAAPGHSISMPSAWLLHRSIGDQLLRKKSAAQRRLFLRQLTRRCWTHWCVSRFDPCTSREDSHMPWQLLSSSPACAGRSHANSLDKRESEVAPNAYARDHGGQNRHSCDRRVRCYRAFQQPSRTATDLVCYLHRRMSNILRASPSCPPASDRPTIARRRRRNAR